MSAPFSFRPHSMLARLARCARGAMAIETAIVAPVLLLMSLGTFEVGRMVSRQHELQSGASEAEAIALAANMGAASDIGTVKDILETSLGLDDDQVQVEERYRCGASPDLVAAKELCDEDDPVSRYMQISMTDTYEPEWTKLGLGDGFTFNVERLVQLP